ncbi:hypothetical protein, conserved [Leishmania tarentolae]|uniref:Leucine-rich repeat protein n=1 Tax=Leishmania tarentolae TaxID=5689 RepID=A0A640KIW9_LEITA|nr:hypothetical protein, conserved [Leishmania tarentolae]
MESPLCPSASIDVDAQGPVLGPVAAQTRAWLSQYGTCCTQEEVEMHPVVLSRVLQAVELAQRQVQHFSASNGAAAANTTRHARRSGEKGSETVTPRSPPTALRGNDASKQSACEAGVSIDFGGLWMPLSEWIATLRSVVATLPLHSLLLRDTALGDAGLRCLCREVSTASVKPETVEAASRCEGGDSHLRGLSRLPAPSSYPPIIPRWCAASTLRLLDLSGAALTDGGPLAPLLASCPYLHSLNLSDNRLGSRDAGLALLCGALQLHPSLEVLNLRHNCICGSRGGPAIAALAELIVARFVEAPRTLSRTCGCASAFCEHQTPTATAAAKPLRRLDLSHNLLGTYFLVSDTTVNRCAEAGCAGETHEYGLTSSAGHHVRAHEAVTSFPLVTAICLNNTLIELDLRNNGLPDALLEYVDAKLRVNQRTTGGDADGLYTASADAIASTTVRQVLIHRLRCTIDHVLAEAAKVSGVVGATHTEPKDAPPAEVPAASQCSVPPAAERRWTTTEVLGLVQCLAHGVASDLSLF